MAPIVPPDVLRNLEPICEATGDTAEEIWARQSQATKVAAAPATWREYWARLTLKKRAVFKNLWSFWGRPAQQIPIVAFFVWLILAGRGWGKTRTGSAFTIDCARKRPGSRGALVGATAGDVRDTMILGDSGIIASSPPDFIPEYEPSKRLLTWPNGSSAICYTADQPNRLRGPNLDWAWCDELAAWRYPQQAWDMLMYCMRRGKNPQCCVTTTPRPIALLRQLVADAKDLANETILTRGSTWENFWHLAERFFRQIVSKNKGSLSRQEIFAELLEDVEGALWEQKILDQTRIQDPRHLPQMERIVVGVDPSEEDGADNDECGIVAVGRCYNNNGYVLADESKREKPHLWARRAYELYLRLDADEIVCEINSGGQMAPDLIRAVVKPGEPVPRIKTVRGKKGKFARAEPIAALWYVLRFHLLGFFGKLEDELCTYVPLISPRSPNRLDAMVWAALALFPQRFLDNKK